MLAFYLNFLILVLKFLSFFLLKVFFYKAIYLKFLCLPVIIYLIYKVYYYKVKETPIDEQYTLSSIFDIIFNSFILISYISLFFFGFLWLRFLNKNRALDLFFYYNKFKEALLTITIGENVVNILLLLGVIILYMVIFMRIMRYIKYHIILRHIYNYKYANYELYQYQYIRKYLLIQIPTFICSLYSKVFYYVVSHIYPNSEQLSWEIKETFFWVFWLHRVRKEIAYCTYYFFFKGHYIILLLCIIYDCIYNNFNLIHMFMILPYVFVWDTYYRVSDFIRYLNTSYDKIIYGFIYKDVTICDENNLIIDGNFIDIREYIFAFDIYLKDGLRYDLAREKEYDRLKENFNINI